MKIAHTEAQSVGALIVCDSGRRGAVGRGSAGGGFLFGYFIFI